MESKILNGIAIFAIGGVIFKVIKTVRERKSLDATNESIGIYEDEHSSKE